MMNATPDIRLSKLVEALPDDMTVRQIALLTLLAASREPMHLRDLARAMRVAKPVITRAANTLQPRGLLTRVNNPSDLRDCMLSATTAGRQLVAKLQGVLA